MDLPGSFLLSGVKKINYKKTPFDCGGKKIKIFLYNADKKCALLYFAFSWMRSGNGFISFGRHDPMEDIREKIERVLKTEQEADQILENARHRKVSMIGETRKRIQEFLEASQLEAEKQIDLEEKRVKEETAKEIQVIREKTASEIETIQAKGNENMADAASIILRSILE